MPRFELPIHTPPRRVVSLVPSMTESLFDLGLGDCVVGATDYCIYPDGPLKSVKRVGGPKDFRIGEIVSLQPDLVIANREENSEELVRQLIERSMAVWLTFPRSVNEALKDLNDLASLFRSSAAAMSLRILEQSVEYCRMAAPETPRRYFCPIWQGEHDGRPWWMTFNQETYSSDLFRILGGENIFAGRSRRYPLIADLDGTVGEPAGGRDTRYPRIGLEEIAAGRPEFVIFPDEPHLFSDIEKRHFCEAMQKLLGYSPDCVSVEGSLVHWPGTRISKALEELNNLFS